MKNKSSNPFQWRPSKLFTSFTILLGSGILMCSLPAFNNVKLTAKLEDPSPITLKAQLVAENLNAPTDMAFPGNGTIWITEQTGKIRVVKNGKLSEVPLLDLHSKLVKLSDSYEERGLLSVALHPKFKTNRKFYVFYSRPSTEKSDHTGVVAEYKLTAGSATVDPNSGRIILTIEEPESNHNGGCVKFGPDGYLYVSFGDGGGQGDKHGKSGNGQKLDTWLAKILRVDVDTKVGYIVPKDNPFFGQQDAKPEIWAYGFRNPYRFSFDKATGRMFTGDVGQDQWEEVDIVTRGANYGWRLMEGTHCYNPATGCLVKGITMPINEYSHKIGVSVIGGYVYNGQQIPGLKNKYVFADWIGKVFFLDKTGDQWQRGNITLQNIPPNLKITGFGEDPAGELYFSTNPDTGPGNVKGGVYKFIKN